MKSIAFITTARNNLTQTVDIFHKPGRSNSQLKAHLEEVYDLDLEVDTVSITPENLVDTVYYDDHHEE